MISHVQFWLRHVVIPAIRDNSMQRQRYGYASGNGIVCLLVLIFIILDADLKTSAWSQELYFYIQCFSFVETSVNRAPLSAALPCRSLLVEERLRE